MIVDKDPDTGGQQSTGTRLRDKIENAIVDGSLPPGTRLDETELAERYGVSRTPIREALLQLAHSGLIEIRPRRGAIVAEVGLDRMIEMFEVMAELEAMAARLAARRCTASDMLALTDALSACREAAAREDRDGYYYENERFHFALYRASHNGFLEEQCIAMNRRLKPYRRLQLRVRNRLGTSLAEHEAIVEALAAQNPEQAERRARGHVVIQADRFSDLIASMGKMGAVA